MPVESLETQLHLIDDSGILQDEHAIQQFMQRTADGECQTVGLRYRVVGVLGGQSSGKSTLLNHTFGTRFSVMDETLGRVQTTKGAFLSKSNIGENIFVLDFEGTDGAEHGEDQSFERQLSLFALSVADILIVNMWATEVGRFNAANLALLRAIFEVNLQLFQHLPAQQQRNRSEAGATAKEKPTLLFVLRDHSQTPLERLISTIKASLVKVWDGVTKPENLTQCKIDDVFELQFTSLPHYQFERGKFDSGVQELKQWFVDPQNPKYLFTMRETFRGIPLADLAKYLHNCWKSIVTSRDLNIPSQRDMLAVCRCSEAVSQLIADFGGFVAQLRSDAQSRRPIHKLSSLLEERVNQVKEEFTNATRLYSPKVVRKYRAQLLEDVNEKVSALMRFQAAIIVTSELSTASTALGRVIDGAVRGLSAPPPAAETAEVQQQLVQQAAGDDGSGAAIREDAAATRSEQHAGRPSTVIRQRLIHAQNVAQVKLFWANVRSGVGKVVKEIQSRLEATRAPDSDGDAANDSLNISDPRLFAFVSALLKDGADAKVLKRFESMAADASTTMNKAFEHALLHEVETGIVRFFATVKGLKQAFGPARHVGMLLLACLFASRLEPESEDPQYDGLMLQIGGVDSMEDPVYPAVDAERAIRRQQAANADLTPATMLHLKAEQARQKWQEEESGIALQGDPAGGDIVEAEHLARLSELRMSTNKIMLSPSGRSDNTTTVDDDALDAAMTPQRQQLNTQQSSSSSVPPVLILLTEANVSRAYELFNQSCQFTYKLQSHSIENNKPHVPLYIFVLLLLLGANEAYWVATSPPLLLFVVIIVYFFFRDWVATQWQTFEETAPPQVVVPLRTGIAVVQRAFHSLSTAATAPPAVHPSKKND